MATELEEPGLEARPLVPNQELCSTRAHPLPSLTSGAFQPEGPSLGGREAGHWGQTCPLPRPASQGMGGSLGGEQAHSARSRAFCKAARQPGLGDSTPACSRGHQQQEKTGWNGSPTAAAKKASSPCPQGFPHLLPGGGRGRQAKSVAEDRPVGNKAGSKRKGALPLEGPPSPLLVTNVQSRQTNSGQEWVWGRVVQTPQGKADPQS